MDISSESFYVFFRENLKKKVSFAILPKTIWSGAEIALIRNIYFLWYMKNVLVFIKKSETKAHFCIQRRIANVLPRKSLRTFSLNEIYIRNSCQTVVKIRPVFHTKSKCSLLHKIPLTPCCVQVVTIKLRELVYSIAFTICMSGEIISMFLLL